MKEAEMPTTINGEAGFKEAQPMWTEMEYVTILAMIVGMDMTAKKDE